MRSLRSAAVALVALLSSRCSSDVTSADAAVTLTEGACAVGAAGAPDSLPRVSCTADFNALGSLPLDATLPGARSVKVVYDTADDTLYFQHSQRFQIHYAFVSTHLSGSGRPTVPALVSFNATEYFSPSRRFILGAVTRYEGPGVWALELSPYDTASAAMAATLYRAVQGAAFFGPALAFHPTSDSVAAMARALPPSVRTVTTEQLYARTDYQPLTLGTAIGRLRFVRAAQLASQFVSFEDIVVLDEAPNDISVVQGLITETFQTPLSHINVLSQNRRTPNMGLRGAMANASLRALEGRVVELVAGASGWTVREASATEAEAFWATRRPTPVTLPPMDLTETRVLPAEQVTPAASAALTLRDAIRGAVRAFGGKTAQYSVLAQTAGLPVRPALGVPMYFYDRFMRENGLWSRLDALLADARFRQDAAWRAAQLIEFQSAMRAGAVSEELQSALRERLPALYAGTQTAVPSRLRFRTSTNSEDLEGFPCAGCYESHSGDPARWTEVLDAIRETYASGWSYRTVEERNYYGVDHRSVGMGLLVHLNFPDEDANGVAVTANPFDPTGLDPAFYVNVQFGGEAEVVHPPPGVTSDQFLYYFSQPGQPATFIARSSLVPAGHSVLTARQTYDLGRALDLIHQRFSLAYGPGAGNAGWYAMDVEFKFDNVVPWGTPQLIVKQARPYPGRGQ